MKITTLLAAIPLALAADQRPMNSGGIPYSISNPDPNSPPYDLSFSKLGEYFEVYGAISTRYSQVYWTRNADVPLPDDIIKRFAGKVMAITGYEIDQVMKTDDGDKSIPIYNAYNHHYFAWLNGADSDLVYYPDRTFHAPNPTHWAPKSKSESQTAYPTNIVFKENPGGEYRKSYHAYPCGYAQLIHSPSTFILEPMQIDTHNRNYSKLATDVNGYEPWFVPDSVKEYVDHSIGLSPLIECPCTDRITRSIQNQSSILTSGTCPALLADEATCFTSIKELVGADNVASTTTVDDTGLPKGCILSPVKGTLNFDAIYNSNESSESMCGPSESIVSKVRGFTALDDVKTSISLSIDAATVQIVVTGPDGGWFGFGLDASSMADFPYAIIVDGDGTISERKLENHGPGTVLESQLVRVGEDKVEGGVRTVTMTRDVDGKSSDHFTFPTAPGNVNFISAVGDSVTIAYHSGRSVGSITLIPSEVESCICAPTQMSFLTYNNVTTDAYNVFCNEAPRSDMALQNNPACKMETYHGGLHCCKHQFFLTDHGQEDMIPEDVDEYFLKFRYYFEEYVEPVESVELEKTEASHKHLTHWVFLIDDAVNDYEEVQCEDGSMCQGMISARLTADQMGLEDKPEDYSTITPYVIDAHCHAPSCIRQELYNEDTGELLCAVEAKYGNGTEVFNEANYIALPPCLFSDLEEEGLRKPFVLERDTNLLAIKIFNTTHRHVGQMAQFTGLMRYDTNTV